MAVNDRQHIGANLVDLAVDETLDIRAASAGVDRVIIEIVFHDVLGRYQGRCARARDEIMFRVLGRAHADMTESVEDILICQDVVHEHQIAQALVILLLGSLRRMIWANVGAAQKPRPASIASVRR